MKPPVAETSFTKSSFEAMYLALREKEHRIYRDEQVALLPDIDPTHIYAREWKTRKRSAERLFLRLQHKKKPLSIAEVGCGNGWLIAKLSALKNVVATGIDINGVELEQAKRVFYRYDNLSFLSTDIEHAGLPNKKFDVILFAASLQYFRSPDSIIQLSLSALNPGGELHIIDSPFYSETEIEAAAARTLQYYRSMGFETMADHYFHLREDTLKQFDTTILYDPSKLANRVFRKHDPFPWVMIEKKHERSITI